MKTVPTLIATLFALCMSNPAHAGEARGTLTVKGTTVTLASAVAFEVMPGTEHASTLVLLSEKPIDLSAALATDDPYFVVLNDKAIDAVTHAKVFVSKERISINAHKAGDDMQYLASQKFGLEASASGGDGKPLVGRLRTKGEDTSVQIDAEFATTIEKAKP